MIRCPGLSSVAENEQPGTGRNRSRGQGGRRCHDRTLSSGASFAQGAVLSQKGEKHPCADPHVLGHAVFLVGGIVGLSEEPSEPLLSDLILSCLPCNVLRLLFHLHTVSVTHVSSISPSRMYGSVASPEPDRE
jgi:hypothetical protein